MIKILHSVVLCARMGRLARKWDRKRNGGWDPTCVLIIPLFVKIATGQLLVYGVPFGVFDIL